MSMSISRWDPWSDIASFRDAMDTLLRERFVMQQRGGVTGALSFPLDIRETGNEYVVQAELPGIRPEDVHLQVKDNTLQISGEVKHEQQEQGQGQWLRRDRQYGRFQRTLTLPMAVESNRANAEFENGVLTVTLPKAPEARAKSIPIRDDRAAQPIEAQAKSQQ